MRPPVRLAALMKLPVTYVWTHDSDRPGRGRPDPPADRAPAPRCAPSRASTSCARPTPTRPPSAWRTILEFTTARRRSALSRQSADPSWIRTRRRAPPAAATCWPTPRRHARVIIIATGSEVGIAITARQRLEEAGTPDTGRVHALRRVVPGPAAGVPATQCCRRASRARVSVGGWRSRPAGGNGSARTGEIVSINHFGASAEGAILFEEFGFTPDHVVAAAQATLSRTGGIGEGHRQLHARQSGR